MRKHRICGPSYCFRERGSSLFSRPTYTVIDRSEKSKLSEWINSKSQLDFNLLYRASTNGFQPDNFHQKCDNKGPTVTIIYGTTGHVFGGYTSLSWAQNGNWTNDVNSFLFTLRNSSGVFQRKLAATVKSQVYLGAGHGPLFGSQNYGNALQVIQNNFNGKTNACGTEPGIVVNLESTNLFDICGMTNEMFSGGCTSVFDIEVYGVKGINLQNKAWRTLDESFIWKPDSFKEITKQHKAPEALNIPETRILLLGPSGGGKSSFFNTINSAFRGHVTNQAATGTGRHSITTKMRAYRVRLGDEPMKFRLCDVMGFEEEGGLIIHDIPYILDGNIQDHFQFNPISSVTPMHKDYKPTPGLADKIHVGVIVLDASEIDDISDFMVNKIRNVSHILVTRDIPRVVLLTKIDKVCDYIENLESMFRNDNILQLVGRVSDLVGVSRSHVLPVKNYDFEITRDDKVDTLALLALVQILKSADDFFNEQLDLIEQ